MIIVFIQLNNHCIEQNLLSLLFEFECSNPTFAFLALTFRCLHLFRSYAIPIDIRYETFDSKTTFKRLMVVLSSQKAASTPNTICLFHFFLSNDMYKNIEINTIYEMESLSFIMISSEGIDALLAESIFLHSNFPMAYSAPTFFTAAHK